MSETQIDVIQIPSEFVELCKKCHGGMGTMMYAIASTGNLTLGSIRLIDCDTNEKWHLYLWDLLLYEASGVDSDEFFDYVWEVAIKLRSNHESKTDKEIG